VSPVQGQLCLPESQFEQTHDVLGRMEIVKPTAIVSNSMPDLATESQPLVNFLALIQGGIDQIVQNYDRITPDWLADQKVPSNWKVTRDVFPNELLIKQRILNDPQILRRMELHGLVGPSLEAKTVFLKKAVEKVREMNEKDSTDVADKRKTAAWLLRAVNSYLISLVGVFPGLASVQEFTQQVELAIEAPV